MLLAKHSHTTIGINEEKEIEVISSSGSYHSNLILKGTNKDVLGIAEKNKIKVKELDKQAINNLLPRGNQGIGAKVEDYKYVDLDESLNKNQNARLYVMLDQLEDPHNLGAILRSADAFNVDGIIIPKNRSVKLNATVAKVSTGAIEHVDVIEVTNLTNTIKKLKEHGFWVVGTDMDTDQTIHNIQVDTDLVIVIGSEGKGISRLVKENCDYVVKIPMSGHVNSLNASVSAGLVIYEVFRKRG